MSDHNESFQRKSKQIYHRIDTELERQRHKPLNQIDFRPPVPEIEAEVGMGGSGPGHVIAGQVPGHQAAPALTNGHTLIR